jgi:16S rRNA (cytidine1402-2'-O)-methyltransferase
MSAPGRPKRESFERQREGSPVSAPGRPKRESLERQREGSPVSAPGALLLLPTLIAECEPDRILPPATIAAARGTAHFLAESAKSARAFLKSVGHPRPIASLDIIEIGHAPDPRRFDGWLQPIIAGRDVALLSEAGCPAIADPGAGIVARAHDLNLHVRPLVGPSSLLLGLMAAGLNGQQFRFAGYLPQERTALIKSLHELERLGRGGETQIFIETPYRNERLLQAIIEHCRPDTRLAVAVDLTGDAEQVRSLSIAGWRALAAAERPELSRRPAVFVLGADQSESAPRARRSPAGRQ